jgi:hypothetical protein
MLPSATRVWRTRLYVVSTSMYVGAGPVELRWGKRVSLGMLAEFRVVDAVRVRMGKPC